MEIDHPKHYCTGKIEAIDVIDDWGCNFYIGNVIKYLSRYQYKDDPLGDLKKAQWYLDRYINSKQRAVEEDADALESKKKG